ncbi:MAG: UDP-N-acetylmuramate--L-alanine ligase [Acidimicrobiia bacterium]
MSAVAGGFDLSTPRRIHVVGAGGTGMSAICTLLSARGHDVSGSDAKDGPFARWLRAHGVRVDVGHDAAHVAGADAVAISSAVGAGNVEVVAAREAGIAVLSRAEILALLTAAYRTVAVAGTHGKTTTASLLVHALDGARLDPSYLLGSQLLATGANAHHAGDVLVCEADESDGTFLELVAAAGIVTNVEADHLERWGDLAGVEAAFREFLERVSGPRVVCVDDPGARQVGAGLDFVGYGLGADARVRAVAVEPSARGARFRLVVDDVDHGWVRLALPGRHNVVNATGALAMAHALGADVSAAAEGVARFRGVGRRFEFRGTTGGVTFVDDYAHLPTEVAAAIAAARDGSWARIVAVFQPHLYSRTIEHADGFGAALAGADVAVVADVFAAREDPDDFPGVSGRVVADAVASRGGTAEYVGERAMLAARVAAIVEPGDLCISIGAGDVTDLAGEMHPLLEGSATLRKRDAVDAVEADLTPLLRTAPVRDVETGTLTTYRVGGRAALFVEPFDVDELLAVARAVRAHDVDVLVVGRGSNLLVGDAGFLGVALRLGPGFNWIETDAATVRAGAATPLPFLARAVGREGLAGLEFGVGIPGSVGGAVRMNAGGHGAEMVDVLTRVGLVDLARPEAGVVERAAPDLGLSYRHAALRDDEIVVWAEFGLTPGDPEAIKARLAEIVRWRKEHHPAGEGNCGSVFTNPPGDHAARLIDSAGLKGMRVGGAYVSDKHANFIMAESWASAADVVELVDAVRARVRARHGVDLHPELRTVGEFT